MNTSIFDLLRGIVNNDYFTLIVDYAEYVYHQIFDFLSVQRLLPPLIMVLAVYLTLLSLYRTTTLLIRTTLFFVKWGGIIAIIAAAVGYFSKGSFSSSKHHRHRTSGPRVWDTFAEHQRWRNAESRPKEITDIIHEIIGEVAGVTQQVVRQGWQQTFSRLVFAADAPEKLKRSSRSAKGKVKSR